MSHYGWVSSRPNEAYKTLPPEYRPSNNERPELGHLGSWWFWTGGYWVWPEPAPAPVYREVAVYFNGVRLREST